MIYTSFAQVYDHLMDDTLYADWLDYVQSRVTPANQQLLELAGGSGTLAVALAQAGYDVTLSDLSEDMLTLAGPKMDAAGVELPIIQADMRYLGDIGPYDVVTCFDDSICYMPNLGDVQTTFKQVAHVLKPGGRFMFDAHSLHQMDDVFPGYMYNYQTEDYAFMWHSYAGEVEHSVEHDLTFFVYQEDLDAYKPFIETHKERTYPVADFVASLTAAGFDDIQVTADFGRQEVTPESKRWFFSAVKTSD
ncbi:hypothetical protein FC50_GL000522 [Lacticaseibacillus pantheris DSM 15945 = JCM 12539 = NBRC 106106]|uniref:Methyltransferase domain-containing protein n=1 Tax=Lacticaseibacillus pantheris DSM 15945 = JCM 12539 = NBRC 106106 TaxID=1423783 RepID=A0A0R1U5X4_9LACO|nr:class I SAM-dependent methyltransferase [Lacticaseibacillus pantheris]KRL86874.1 hypothetical protein FC50_GL000522 [Lacticaseibacillus pantheris DSM 15945 = JCM 12539 = NBRC 106106]